MTDPAPQTDAAAAPKCVSILGSTGSIGTQTLEVAEALPERLQIVALTARRNVELLAAQARRFQPRLVAIADEAQYPALQQALAGTGIECLAGAEGLKAAATLPQADTVLTALVGFAGLEPTIAAIEAGKNIALANKETLVVAGRLINPMAKAHGVEILPVDSEHSAIFQCLVGEPPHAIEKLILTASGGPFRGYSSRDLQHVSCKQALKHPNWEMGAKITIDSASLMNKGLEVIEARWLFNLPPAQIDVVVHPESIVHSMVQFADGSIKAQLGLPDMRLPIQYALTYPERPRNAFPRTDFPALGKIHFEAPDRATFRSLDFAFHALEQCGNLPCILNAANEIAVAAFLREQIGFLQLYDILEESMQRVPYLADPTLDALLETDRETRQLAGSLV